MIGIGISPCWRTPNRLLLRDSDDPKFIANAVEELMRYLSIIQNGQRRVAIEDIEIAARPSAAARASSSTSLQPTGTPRLPEPDKLDLSRDAGQQLGFGYGRHQCVGQQLARAELQIVFHTLLRRILTLKLAIRSTRCRSSTTASPTASTNSRSPGDLHALTARLEYHRMTTPRPLSARGLRRTQEPQRSRDGRRPDRAPEGTEIFSADNHISVADIFYERFPRNSRVRRRASGTRTARTWSA